MRRSACARLCLAAGHRQTAAGLGWGRLRRALRRATGRCIQRGSKSSFPLCKSGPALTGARPANAVHPCSAPGARLRRGAVPPGRQGKIPNCANYFFAQHRAGGFAAVRGGASPAARPKWESAGNRSVKRAISHLPSRSARAGQRSPERVLQTPPILAAHRGAPAARGRPSGTARRIFKSRKQLFRAFRGVGGDASHAAPSHRPLHTARVKIFLPALQERASARRSASCKRRPYLQRTGARLRRGAVPPGRQGKFSNCANSLFAQRCANGFARRASHRFTLLPTR